MTGGVPLLTLLLLPVLDGRRDAELDARPAIERRAAARACVRGNAGNHLTDIGA